jgi:hypothetical protein
MAAPAEYLQRCISNTSEFHQIHFKPQIGASKTCVTYGCHRKRAGKEVAMAGAMQHTMNLNAKYQRCN